MVNIGSGNGMGAWGNQANTWTNVDLSSQVFCESNFSRSAHKLVHVFTDGDFQNYYNISQGSVS